MNPETADLVIELHNLRQHLDRAIAALDRVPADYATAALQLDIVVTDAPLVQGIYEIVRDRDTSSGAPPP